MGLIDRTLPPSEAADGFGSVFPTGETPRAAALRAVGTIASWRPPAERAPEPDRARKGRACRAGAAGVSNAPDHS